MCDPFLTVSVVPKNSDVGVSGWLISVCWEPDKDSKRHIHTSS